MSPSPGRLGTLAAGILGGAAVIGVLSLLTRVVGFGRQLVFQDTLGETALGSVYTAANALPTITFEIVAGGALASAVVPVLAGVAARGDRVVVRQIVSALLGWTLLLLVPVAVLGTLLAGPVSAAVLGAPLDSREVEVASSLLRFFLPQIPLYGVAVVTAGALQAHRRFVAAALAPLVSSAAMIAMFLAFGATFGGDLADLDTVVAGDEMLLGLGTTGAVALLALVSAVPLLVRVTGLVPTLRFPPGVAVRARSLALAGLAGLVAQQVAVLLSYAAAGRTAEVGTGTVVTYANSWMVYLLPYAVLVLPVITSSFPRLAQDADVTQEADVPQDVAVTSDPAVVPATAGDGPGAFTDVLARTSRVVTATAALGAAVLIATAWPIGDFFRTLSAADPAPDSERMAWALVTFAPGLIAFGLVTHLSRALYARGRSRAGATGALAGWGSVALLAVLLPQLVPTGALVAALGAAHTLGLTVGVVVLVRIIRRDVGAVALAGVGRTAVVGAAAVLAGGPLGAGLSLLLGAGELTGLGAALGVGVLAAAVATLVAVLCWVLGDRAGLRAVLRR